MDSCNTRGLAKSRKMSRQGKKGGNKLEEKKGGNKLKEKKSGSHKVYAISPGDVTLADFANSAVAKGRLQKARLTDSVVREVKQLNIEDKTWDEKLEEFDGDFDFVKEENEDGEEVFVMKKVNQNKKTLNESIGQESCFKTYPLDVWFLIAQYIRPEDTITFASICRSAWNVVNTPTFWLNLYKRYYKNVPNLPARLRPECMVRHHGLKACVVRSLYYMYPPLVARVELGFMTTPYDLCSRQCISFWQERRNNKWKMCFKMRRKDYKPKQASEGKKPDLMEILEDIFANTDDGCTMLQVVSSEKTIPPAVMGLTLHSIQMRKELTHASMNVQLVFGSGRICNGHLDSTSTVTLSLKTVLQVSALDWWHPRYPHSSHTLINEHDDT